MLSYDSCRVHKTEWNPRLPGIWREASRACLVHVSDNSVPSVVLFVFYSSSKSFVRDW